VKIHRLKESDKTKYEIYDALKAVVSKCKKWNELKKKLQEQGITTDFKYRGNTNEVQGVMFEKNGYKFNGPKIDRQFSYSKVDFQLNRITGTGYSYSTALQPFSKSTFHFGKYCFDFGELFDIPSSLGTNYDPDEAEFQRQLKRKKKKQRRPHL
jgi:hypothetical protein